LISIESFSIAVDLIGSADEFGSTSGHRLANPNDVEADDVKGFHSIVNVSRAFLAGNKIQYFHFFDSSSNDIFNPNYFVTSSESAFSIRFATEN
jgi:hypothetical protein